MWNRKRESRLRCDLIRELLNFCKSVCIAVAGIGGFAIFWFAVKKKTFADLGVALKKGFTAMGNFFKTLGAKIKALFSKKK